MIRRSILMLTVLASACGGKGAEPTTAPEATHDAASPIAADDPRNAVLAEIPEPLRPDPSAVTPAVKALSEKLPKDLPGLAAAIAAEPSLTARRFPGDAPDAPRSADALAQAIAAKLKVAVAPFERLILMSSILRARNVTPQFGWVQGARHSATELLARRFVLRTPEGAWVSPEGAPVDGAAAEKVRALDIVDLHAHDLAFRALGAIAAEDAELGARAAGLARRLRPDDPAILFVAARSELQNGLLEAASATMDKAAAIESDAMTYFALGRQARLEERPFKADEYFRKAAEADPRFAEPHIGLANLALDRMDLTPADQHPALTEAAKKAAADARAADPNARGLRVVEAQLAAMADDYPTAIKLLTEETTLHPDDEQAWMTLAQVQNVQQQPDEALKTLETARKNGLTSTEILNGLGALYVNAEQFDKALEAFQASLEKDPSDPDVRPQIAQLMMRGGDTAGAKKHLEAQVAKFPDTLEPYLLLAQVLLESQQIDAALAQIDKVLSKDAKHREARMLAYLARVATGKPADSYREGAIEAAGSRRNLAQLFFQNGLAAEAEALLVEALEKDDKDVVAPVMLAAIYAATDRVPKAEELRDTVVAALAEADRAEMQKLFDQAIEQGKAQADPTPPIPEP